MSQIISLFILVLFYSCSASKKIKQRCPLSVVSVDTSQSNPMKFLMRIPLGTTYIRFGYGFKDTASIKIGAKVYRDIEIVSGRISDDVQDVQYKLSFKDNKPIPFEVTTANCRIWLKTDILYGYKYLQIHYDKDVFILNYFK